MTGYSLVKLLGKWAVTRTDSYGYCKYAEPEYKKGSFFRHRGPTGRVADWWADEDLVAGYCLMDEATARLVYDNITKEATAKREAGCAVNNPIIVETYTSGLE